MILQMQPPSPGFLSGLASLPGAYVLTGRREGKQGQAEGLALPAEQGFWSDVVHLECPSAILGRQTSSGNNGVEKKTVTQPVEASDSSTNPPTGPGKGSGHPGPARKRTETVSSDLVADRAFWGHWSPQKVSHRERRTLETA